MELPASEKLIELAGYILAHALWTASQAGNGEGRAFDPYAGVVQDGNLQMVQFNAESENLSDANTQALDYLVEHSDDYMAWALAVDMLSVQLSKDADPAKLDLREREKSEMEIIDSIVITAWEEGLQEPIVVHQQYAPQSSGRFRLLGTPLFAIGGDEVSEAVSSACLDPLRSGILHHEDAARHWESWS